jgi:hypothetical protein
MAINEVPNKSILTPTGGFLASGIPTRLIHTLAVGLLGHYAERFVMPSISTGLSAAVLGVSMARSTIYAKRTSATMIG